MIHRKTQSQNNRGIIVALIISAFLLTALALALIWFNNERTRLAYSVRKYQKEVEDLLDHNAKLELEHSFLMSPQELNRRAALLGLRGALPGEIRRLELYPQGSKE